jgi:chemotaxis protein CheC
MNGEINQAQLDLLKELGSIGSGNAATALSKLISESVNITVPETRILKVEQVPHLLGQEEEVYAVVCMEIVSEVKGAIFLIFERGQALRLANDILNQQGLLFTDLMISSLKECGNICINMYLNAISIITGLRLYPSIPSLAVDMIGAILDGVGIEFSENKTQSYVVENAFYIGNHRVSGTFLFVPDPDSLKAIFKHVRLRDETVA